MTLARLDSSQDQHAILVHDFRKWAQQDSFNPAENRRIGSDPESQTQDDQ
jgi:hypothetical protein